MIQHKNKLLAALAAGALFLSAPASADHWSVGVSGLGISTDSARENDFSADGGTGFEIDVRYNLSDCRAIELNYAGWAINVSPSNNDKGVDNLTLNYLWGQLAGKHQAYGLVGVGAGRADLSNGDETNYSIFNLGIGWQSAVAERWSVGAELKMQRSKDDSSVAGIDDYDDIILGAGVRYRFGG